MFAQDLLMSLNYCDLRFNALDVEVGELDVDFLIMSSIEDVITFGVARVDAGEIGRCKCAVGKRVTLEAE